MLSRLYDRHHSLLLLLSSAASNLGSGIFVMEVLADQKIEVPLQMQSSDYHEIRQNLWQTGLGFKETVQLCNIYQIVYFYFNTKSSCK